MHFTHLQDWHIHTHRSLCGKPENTVPAIVDALNRSNVKMAGLSDHMDIPQQRERFEGVTRENRTDLSQLSSSCTLWVGTEATMLSPACCALPIDLASQLDFVILACNHYHLKEVENPEPGTAESYALHHLDMILGAMEFPRVDTISHPFVLNKLGKDRSYDVLKHYPEERLRQVLQKASEKNVAFEINPYIVQHATEWFRDLIQEARSLGTKFTLGSDSHRLASIGYQDIKIETVCRQIGLLPTDLKWSPGLGG